jgi:hypothetical protein
MILHPDLLADSTKVLELGSGTGLLGLLAHTLSPSTHVYLSDSNPAVLARLQLNINLSPSVRPSLSPSIALSFLRPLPPLPSLSLCSMVIELGCVLNRLAKGSG